MELDGKPPRELAPEFLGEFAFLRAAWHPDGQRISLWGSHLKRPHLGWSFWTISLSSGATVKSEISAEVERQLKTSVSFKDFSNFLWAPSGQALYFEGSYEGVRNLWRVEVEPQTLRWIAGPERLTTDPGPDTEIAISPDGKKLAYTIRTERTRIWSLPFKATTGRVKGAGQPVTSADKDAWKLDLSRDGRKLVFAASRAGKEELWEKSLDDGRETLLRPADDFTRYSPRWSRDGLQLVYRRDRGTDPDQVRSFSIVRTPTGGGDEQLVTFPSRFDEFAYDWSADGEWILGNSERHSPGRYLIGMFPLRAAPHAENQMRVVTSHPEYTLGSHASLPMSAGFVLTLSKRPRPESPPFMSCRHLAATGRPSPKADTGKGRPVGRMMARRSTLSRIAQVFSTCGASASIRARGSRRARPFA